MLDRITSDMFSAPVSELALKLISKKSQLGQFMTPQPIAQFMAQMFEGPFPECVKLLDAGAGRGSLTCAFVEAWSERGLNGSLTAHAYEYDHELLDELDLNLTDLEKSILFEKRIFPGDFVEKAATMIKLGRGPRYTHAILNPPYKKINSFSDHRYQLRAARLETVNLYSGFVGLALELLEQGGELVAIIPRSFCNGPYYQPFRRFMLQRSAIRHIHLFEARNQAFRKDDVLQENIIIRLVKGEQQASVTISTSRDQTFSDYGEVDHSFDRIVMPRDADCVIHIPTNSEAEFLEQSAFDFTLADVGVSVSTGPVVDFRMKDSLRADPEAGTVPLLYPGHFVGENLEWPRPGFKKANAIKHNAATQKWLYPTGYYAVVRRFSSKEERRRIMANVVRPDRLNAPMVGFENHLNVFHANKGSLPEELAYGLTLYLNSTPVDSYFRRFNGHTQVNVTDLKMMRYPSRERLVKLGAWSMANGPATQEIIDQKIEELA